MLNRIYRNHVAVAVILFIILSIMVSCSHEKKEKQMIRPVAPVTVEEAQLKAIPVQITAIGNVEACKTVGIKAQIGGTLMKVHFTEGQIVKKGDLLFTIDPRPFETALRQAEAVLARDRAQLGNAKREADRYADLVKKGYVSQEQYEQFRTNSDALEAIVQADIAQVENARLQLSYCYIHAPISGRTGSLMVHQGNLVKANADNPLVTIHQTQPINVTFTVPEKYLLEIRRHSATGRLKVEAYTAKEEKTAVSGILNFIDNAVDASTGTIRMKAQFPNTDGHLWPGQFVTTIMTLSVKENAVIVPASAVQTGQQGQFVFVIKDDSTAEMRPVSLGQTFQGLVVIEKGLNSGEKVVTDGQMRLMPGAKVEIKGKGEGNKNMGHEAESRGQGITK